MVQGYYTLEEAAKLLSMPTEELKHMAQRKEIRSFQDRGTLRFRAQDVEELGRRRGAGSDPDLAIGEAPPPTPRVGPKSPSSPRPSKQASPKPSKDVFSFLPQDDVDIGNEVLADVPSGARRSSPKPAASPPAHKSPARPPEGSGSDVKLVPDHVQPGSDSDVKLQGPDSDVKISDATAKTPKVARRPSISPLPQKSPVPGTPGSGSKKPPSGAAVQPPDSGVRLVPMDSDSDVKIVGAGSDEVPLGASPAQSSTDSDIRLEKHTPPPSESGEGELLQTEEIDLDEEVRRQDAAAREPQRLKPKSKVKFPTTSPFELSETDAGTAPRAPTPKPTPKSAAKKKSPEDSSDFDLTPAGDSGAGLLPTDSSDDFSLELPDDSALAGEPMNLSGPSSGISLDNPVDAGISLEEEGQADLDLSLEVESTPKPAPVGRPNDSDSEFELTLDADDSGKQPVAASPGDSDSEFELTLDDSGSLSPLESAEVSAVKGDSGEKDIFETDFEVPALEEESGSQVAALDTDLESSDFDIALDDSAVEDESASQVVALDEEADDAAATRAQEEGVEDEEFGGLEVAEGEEEPAVEEDLDEATTVVQEKLIEPAPWGVLPVVFMLPCVIIMLLVGLLGFELVQSVGGFKSAGFLTKAVSEMIGKPIK